MSNKERFTDIVGQLDRYGCPSEPILNLLEAVTDLNEDVCNMRLLTHSLPKIRTALTPFQELTEEGAAPANDTALRRAGLYLDRLVPNGCNEVKTLRRLVAAAQRQDTFLIACRKFPRADHAPVCPSDCPCVQTRSFSGYQTDEVKPAGHNPIRATPYDSEAKPYDVLLPSPRNTVLSVDLPAFDGYATGGES